MFTRDEARELLTKANVFFSDDNEGDANWAQMLNLSDTFSWACADGEEVADEELPEVARLFWHYGWCGILYWVSEKRDKMETQFHDNNRFIEFVRFEEAIRKEEPDSSRRACLKREYTVGVD